MGWLEAVVLGLVQGLTEFLPVSSSAHQLLAGQLFFGGHDPGAAFTAVTQLGTETAVLIYFWRDIVRIVKAWCLSLVGKVPRSDPDARLGWFVIAGSIPIAVLGLLFEDAIATSLRNLWVTVAMLFFVGIILWVADLHAAKVARSLPYNPYIPDAPAEARLSAPARRALPEDAPEAAPAASGVADSPAVGAAPQTGGKTLDHMSWRDALILGLCQAAALIPGVSRSGATTSGGLFLGYDRPSAARYSFLLALPAVFASGLYELKGIGAETVAWGPTILATGIAFVVGFAVIAWLLRYVSTHTFRPFAAYRVVLALVVAGLLLGDVLSAGGS